MPATPLVLPAGAPLSVPASIGCQLDWRGGREFGRDGLGWSRRGSLRRNSCQRRQADTGCSGGAHGPVSLVFQRYNSKISAVSIMMNQTIKRLQNCHNHIVFCDPERRSGSDRMAIAKERSVLVDSLKKEEGRDKRGRFVKGASGN